jgi:hypothetical protein
MSGAGLAAELQDVTPPSLGTMETLDNMFVQEDLHRREKEVEQREAAVEEDKKEVQRLWQEVQRKEEKVQLDREELERRITNMAAPLLFDTLERWHKEVEKVRTLEAEKKARELTVVECFVVLSEALSNGEGIDLVVVDKEGVNESHLDKEEKVWVMVYPVEGRRLLHQVRFEVALNIDGVSVTRRLLGVTFQRFGNAPGELCVQLEKVEGEKKYRLVDARRTERKKEKEEKKKKKAVAQAQPEEQDGLGEAVPPPSLIQVEQTVSPRSVLAVAGVVQPDAEAIASVRKDGAKSKAELLKKKKKREAPTDEAPLEVHGSVEEDAARKQHRQADMVVFLLPEKWDLTVFEPCTPVAIVSANGKLFPTTQPRLDHKVVCWTVTADPRGVCKGHFRPWMVAFPDGYVRGGAEAVAVVLAGLVLVKATDERVVISSDKTLYCDGHVVGKIVQVSNIEPAPFGYVYAFVGSLLDAVNARRVPRRYVQYLAHEPLEIQQVGVMAAKLGQLDAVKHCREILYDSVVMCSSLSRGFRLYRAAIREMLGASLLQAEVFTYLCDYADLATIKVVALMLSEVVAEPEPASTPAWSRA